MALSGTLQSLNVARATPVAINGRKVMTGIGKRSVDGPLAVLPLGLEGDEQAALSVHGGLSKAVYAYPSEHYASWKAELPGVDLPWGMFGENFTTAGLLEEAVYIGDRFGIGEAEVVVTEPRMPCYKLGLKFGDPSIIRRFLASRRTGFYFAVLREGVVGAGDTFQLIGGEQKEISVADVTRLYAFDRGDAKSLQLALTVRALPEGWKTYFRHQLEKGMSPRTNNR